MRFNDIHIDMDRMSRGLGQVVDKWLGVVMDFAVLALFGARYPISEISLHGVPHKVQVDG